jgi:hypothetical protein
MAASPGFRERLKIPGIVQVDMGYHGGVLASAAIHASSAIKNSPSEIFQDWSEPR